MQKKSFKSISFIMTFVMVVSLSFGSYEIIKKPSQNVYAEEVVFANAKCGENAYWTLDATNSILTIHGTGAVDTYNFDTDVDTVVIEEGITAIGKNAFMNSSLKELCFPDTLKEIGENAFWGCENLKVVSLPKSVTQIGETAFEKCTSLAEIIVEKDNSSYLSSDGILYDKYMTELLLYPAAKEGETFTIPSSVIRLGFYAFDYNSKLKKLIIPAGLISLGEGNPFTLATAIENFVVDQNNGTFCSDSGVLYDKTKSRLIKYPCGSSASFFEIPDTVTAIDTIAFQKTVCLEEVVIPFRTGKIGYGAFSDCENLRKVTVSNPDCSFSAGLFTGTNAALTLCGYDNSTALEYAQKTGLPFEELDEGEIDFIEIASLPYKTIYEPTDSLNTSGLKIKVNYKDGTYLIRGLGFTTDVSNLSSLGIHTVIVSYEAFTTEFEIETVNSLEDVSIENGLIKRVSVNQAGDDNITYFTPDVSGNYVFYALSTTDTIGRIEDASGNILTENDDSKSSADFYMTCHLKAQNTYKFISSFADEKEIGDFDIFVRLLEAEESTTEAGESGTVTKPDASGTIVEQTENKEPVTTKNVQQTTEKVIESTNTSAQTTVSLKNSGQKTESIPRKPGKVKIKKLKKIKKTRIRLSWKKLKNVSGYQILCATNKSFSKNKKIVKIRKEGKTKKLIKGLKTKKTYYVKIRAYRKSGSKKIYGSWSKYKKIKL